MAVAADLDAFATHGDPARAGTELAGLSARHVLEEGSAGVDESQTAKDAAEGLDVHG